MDNKLERHKLYVPLNDGIDHINTYSRGHTDLGKCLSNFYNYKFKMEDKEFHSVEAYWYYKVFVELRKIDEVSVLFDFDVVFNTIIKTYSAPKLKNYCRKIIDTHKLNPKVIIITSSDSFKNSILLAVRYKIVNDPLTNELFFKNANLNEPLRYTHYYYYGKIDNCRVIQVEDYYWSSDYLDELTKSIKVHNATKK